MLAVSGELKPDAGGAGTHFNEPRRTIYTRFMRNTRDPLADVFDAPQWFTSAVSRDTTTTPVQSLLIANSAMLRDRWQAFASRLLKLAPTDAAEQVRAAYRLAFGRAPTTEEVNAATAFLAAQTAWADVKKLGSGQAAFMPDKIPYRDGQAALIEPAGAQAMFRAAGSEGMPIDGAFTIEAFVAPRSRPRNCSTQRKASPHPRSATGALSKSPTCSPTPAATAARSNAPPRPPPPQPLPHTPRSGTSARPC